MRRALKILGVIIVVATAAAIVLYTFGLRVVIYGGGSPRLEFIESERAHLRRIEQDRVAQRAAAVAAAAAPQSQRSVPRGGADAAPAAPPDAVPPARTPASVEPSPYWTDFRGPLRDGHYRQRPILTSWPSTGLVPLWKHPIGGGYASFSIARGRAFTIEQRGEEEVAAAYDVLTGRELWTSTWTAAFRETMGGDGPRATPTWHDGRLYVLGALGELRCLDESSGRMLWRTNILDDAGAKNLQWGMAVSPLVVGETVIVLPGGAGGRSIVAYDRHTGSRAWSALDDQQAYSSPVLVTLAGARQLLVFSASRLMGLSERGNVLWEYPWVTQYGVNASQPLVIGDNRVFISTGYGAGAAVVEIARESERFVVREIWRNVRMKNQFTSSVLQDGYIYGLDEAILACIDAGTGELKWKGGRYGYGQVLLASGHLIVLTEDGDLALVRATPQGHEEIARLPALEGKTWNVPAMSDGILLIRNANEMAAYDLREQSSR